ncbi:ATP-binding protein [Microbacterium sp. A93]|uniref:ATP-binding protein n=1 Tax=Microbacterium sp. A93 TaxID=3450716 RepID=UPI003F444ECA
MHGTPTSHISTLPEDSRLDALLETPEDQWFDRKSARVAPRGLAPLLVAFANAEGGTVAIGVHNGQYDGHLLTPERRSALRQVAMDHTSPPVRMETEEVSLDHQRTALLIHVRPGEQVYETSKGDAYLRVGDETRKLGFNQRRELAYDRGSAQFEGEAAPGAGPEDLDPVQFQRYREAIGADADDPRALRARSLLTRTGNLTVAGLLLLGRSPQQYLPQALVRVMRFSERDPGTGSRQSLESGKDRRFEGPIPDIIDHAADCISQWMPKRRALGTSRRFEDIPLLPADVWLEGLVNAVVHRSYSLAGDHIRVSIFPDRVEIESPGRFPGLADPTRPLDIARYARNPRIARVCSDLGITLERGEGIRRMFEEMRELGLVDPLFEQTGGSVRLTLAAASRLDPKLESQLPAGADDLIRMLRQQGGAIGTGEIVEQSGRSRPWVRAVLETLRDAGVVAWDGKSPKDPRATWRLVD